MILWLGLALMTLVALVFVIGPMLLHSRRDGDSSRGAENLSVHRDRLRELDNDVRAGLLNADEAESAKNELAANLLADLDQSGTEEHRNGGGRRAVLISVLIVVIAIPAVAGAVYWSAGTWRVAEGRSAVGAPSMPAMIAKLKAYLKSQPDDVEGWSMLGRAYSVVGHYADAAAAFGQANRLSGNKSADLLVRQGMALAQAGDGELRGKPRTLFESALKLDPGDARALWYAGAAAYQAGEFGQASTYWQRLKGQGGLSPDVASALTAHINDARAHAGLMPLAANGVKKPAAAGGVRIPVEVTLAPALTDAVQAGATLFIFAKAADGPPMPLAVVRRHVSDLPLQVTLNDGMAMTPNAKMSAFDRWVVTARISRSGSPMPSPGDLYARTTVTKASLPATVHLEINQRVQ